MKTVRAISAMVLAAALGCAPMASAQRGGGHVGGGVRGGFSGGHAAPAFRGSGSYAARPGYAARLGYAARPAYPARPGYPARAGLRVVGRGAYGLGYGYPFGPGFYDSGIGFSFPGDYNPNEETNAPGPYADPNAGAYAEPSPGPNDGPYRQQTSAGYRPAQPAPAPEDAVTLIFKDGRPPLEIHNYALTRTTVYVTDARHRDIPVADLDLAATVKVNADAGVPFQLPKPN